MTSAVVTADWKITIPEETRERLNLKPGDRFEFIFREDGSTVIVPLRGRVADLEGILVARRHLTIEEIDEVIHQKVAEDWERQQREYRGPGE
ncbi:MAG: AbrB/MazE/SpoVT family DNA-binding domain-containing protein [Candidatus Omnitrophica bacterium]|nr:AbrB/MazE/SpoVT family DNA-binding domain-containing protein [Candidatus Omnitrophota bacterium]MCA9428182.1 AbrB/MazE/SpoVT family DNA-binding domain-containing protein [Candidatus Omnitrophota bacterium]MCA9441870.1 AbrB/MazE/SpoVT family DNA-binding domain-containing protein [Candidatus Omnitrophota bacterium]MCA9449882.1 AbrB/MazE/SpoVT family DNA-binding domain-containing protein [Candidatus Omnitrophota bacterium]